jgi:LSD1 subclass zinc finger protein
MDKSRKNEHLLDDYKRAAGTKDCPKCATLIEKTDGCNHIECSGCHGHICWYVRVYMLRVQDMR